MRQTQNADEIRDMREVIRYQSLPLSHNHVRREWAWGWGWRKVGRGMSWSWSLGLELELGLCLRVGKLAGICCNDRLVIMVRWQGYCLTRVCLVVTNPRGYHKKRCGFRQWKLGDTKMSVGKGFRYRCIRRREMRNDRWMTCPNNHTKCIEFQMIGSTIRVKQHILRTQLDNGRDLNQAIGVRIALLSRWLLFTCMNFTERPSIQHQGRSELE